MAEAIGINLKITQMPATRPDGMFSYLNYPKSVETDDGFAGIEYKNQCLRILKPLMTLFFTAKSLECSAMHKHFWSVGLLSVSICN